jgi:hypothetical protein
MIWGDEDDKKGVSHSTWVPINIYPNLIPEKVGVYIFADDDFDVKYICNTGIEGMRRGIADGITLGKDRDATQVKALYTESFSDAESLRINLTAKYNPPNN